LYDNNPVAILAAEIIQIYVKEKLLPRLSQLKIEKTMKVKGNNSILLSPKFFGFNSSRPNSSSVES
jgi:hypothetical protein